LAKKKNTPVRIPFPFELTANSEQKKDMTGWLTGGGGGQKVTECNGASTTRRAKGVGTEGGKDKPHSKRSPIKQTGNGIAWGVSHFDNL